jgi:hypothetical protein
MGIRLIDIEEVEDLNPIPLVHCIRSGATLLFADEKTHILLKRPQGNRSPNEEIITRWKADAETQRRVPRVSVSLIHRVIFCYVSVPYQGVSQSEASPQYLGT